MILERAINDGGMTAIRGGGKTMVEWQEGMKLVNDGCLEVTGDSENRYWFITDKGRRDFEDVRQEAEYMHSLRI